MALLKQILHASEFYQWQAVLDFYASVIKSIEFGVKNWGSSFDEERCLILGSQALLSNASAVASRGPAKLWCKEFQQGKCALGAPHDQDFGGKILQVFHVCARCQQSGHGSVTCMRK